MSEKRIAVFVKCPFCKEGRVKANIDNNGYQLYVDCDECLGRGEVERDIDPEALAIFEAVLDGRLGKMEYNAIRQMANGTARIEQVLDGKYQRWIVERTPTPTEPCAECGDTGIIPGICGDGPPLNWFCSCPKGTGKREE